MAQGTRAGPAVNEIVYWLELHAKEELEALRTELGAARDPAVHAMLEPGVPADGPPTSPRADAATVVLRFLGSALRKLAPKLARAEELVRRSRRWQLAASILAVVGSASVWATFRAAGLGLGADLIAGLITLGGGIIAVVSAHHSQEPLAGKSVLEYYRQLVEHKVKAEQLKIVLSMRLEAGMIGSSEDPLIAKANELAVLLKSL